jgi:hypothetical protein
LPKRSCSASAETIQTIIKESGFKWRHARVVLTSNDPDYRVKVEAVTKIHILPSILNGLVKRYGAKNVYQVCSQKVKIVKIRCTNI